MKIKVLFYSHTIDYAGTWRAHEKTLLNLNKDIFQPYVIYNKNVNNNRLDYLFDNLNSQFIYSFDTDGIKTGSELGYSFINSNFDEKVKEISPDIIHFARSGYFEWPFTKRLSPIQIETNIFGFKDNSEFLDYSLPISNTINKTRGYGIKNTEVIHYPLSIPLENDDNLKKEFNISEDTFVLGRIGRPDNFHSIAIDTCKSLKDLKINFKYIIIGACEITKKKIIEYNLQENVIVINPTSDDFFIHKFYNTIDVFAHYRSDGETFGTAIAESMTYGKPVVSHYADSNAQVEVIGDSGFVCKDSMEYLLKILLLINNKELYLNLSKRAKENSSCYLIENIVPKIEKIYLKLLNK